MLTIYDFDSVENYPYEFMAHPPSSFLWDYIASNYVKAFVRLFKPKRVLFMKRYEDHPTFDKDLLSYGSLNWTKYGDDIKIFGEDNTHWWTAYLDCDVSDCSLAKIEKSKCSFEEWVEFFTLNQGTEACVIHTENLDASKGLYVV